MTEEPIDLGPLDPTADAARFDATVAAVMRDAALELRRRRLGWTAMGQLDRWRRPMLAAAAVMVLVSGAVLWQTRPRSLQTETGVAEALGVPTQLATWVRDDALPSPEQLLFALPEIDQ